ncbi:MAG TPA: c-type cytochrome [Blastocatellia bacterium]|nr:c-type cytochrome [Blastocatellia bacterium]
MKTKLIRGAILSLAAVLAIAWVGSPRNALASMQDVEKGHKLFNQHCASCHGTDGKGKGPVAPSLKVSPTDLTMLQKKGEPFPFAHVQIAIDGEKTERSITAHGTDKMPVWGVIFRQMKGEMVKQGDIYALTRFIESIQVFKK